jgi:hypothetical protein
MPQPREIVQKIIIILHALLEINLSSIYEGRTQIFSFVARQ